MALTLNTNIDSLTAQNNLTTSQGLLSQSLTRLSSGLRINSAADDAAGLAISQGFTTQINGTNQAINNANDAVSEAQTTAGALTTIVNNLQSIRTLAVEAANGSNSASDRTALNNQVQQQIAEITQIAAQTSFNGVSVLSGAAGTTTYQVGANVGNTIGINLSQGVASNQIGQTATTTLTATASTFSNTGTLTIAVNGGTAITINNPAAGSNNAVGQASDSAYATAAAINGSGISGLVATASTTSNVTSFTGINSAAGTYQLSINGVYIYGNSSGGQTLSGAISIQQFESAVNTDSAQTGVTASTNSAGGITLTAADGSNIQYSQTEGTSNNGGFTTTAATGTGLTQGSVTLTAAQSISIGGTAVAAAGGTSGLYGQGQTTLASQNVSTVAGADSTIESVDSALTTVSALQSALGAIQNRFTSAVQSLTSTAQNLSQSRSTIQDANFAQETANLTQAQVLEQAGISVLSQANQEPQLILKLLG